MKDAGRWVVVRLVKFGLHLDRSMRTRLGQKRTADLESGDSVYLSSMISGMKSDRKWCDEARSTSTPDRSGTRYSITYPDIRYSTYGQSNGGNEISVVGLLVLDNILDEIRLEVKVGGRSEKLLFSSLGEYRSTFWIQLD